MTVWAIVVAGGRGERFGAPGDPAARKQFVELAGVPVVTRAVTTAAECCDAVVLVLPADAVGAVLSPDTVPGVTRVVTGGATRADSVRAGLAAVPDTAAVVVVHDAARPLASAALFARVVDAVRNGADAAVPGVPVSDTVKRVVGDRVEATVPRDDLVAVQTPQAFRADALRAAHAGEPEASDDAAVIERAGGTVIVVPGEPRNLKITTPFDVVLADAIVRATGEGR